MLPQPRLSASLNNLISLLISSQFISVHQQFIQLIQLIQSILLLLKLCSSHCLTNHDFP